MPGWKYVMDTTTENRVYNIARRNYLEKYEDYKDEAPYVEIGCRRIFVHSRRKKRKWLTKRVLPKLQEPLASGTHVLMRNPWMHIPWSYPSTLNDLSDETVVGVVRSFRPPREQYPSWDYSRYTSPLKPLGKAFSRERRYIVEPLVGKSKGRLLLYDAGWLQIVDPKDLPTILFVLRVQEMKGTI